MPERYFRVRKTQALTFETQGPERRRRECEWVRRRADVVTETRQGQLFGARASAVLVSRLEDKNAPPGFGECDGRHKPVRTGADDDSVYLGKGLSRSVRRHPESLSGLTGHCFRPRAKRRS